jgi:hypothetical protein
MGAFHDNYWPQRSAALAARLQEYTPAEMISAVLYADDLQRMPADDFATQRHCDAKGE